MLFYDWLITLQDFSIGIWPSLWRYGKIEDCHSHLYPWGSEALFQVCIRLRGRDAHYKRFEGFPWVPTPGYWWPSLPTAAQGRIREGSVVSLCLIICYAHYCWLTYNFISNFLDHVGDGSIQITDGDFPSFLYPSETAYDEENEDIGFSGIPPSSSISPHFHWSILGNRP